MRNNQPPIVPPGVPIVGQQRFVNQCPRGHLEVAPGPMQTVLLGPDGKPIPIDICRMCLIDFWGWFRVMTVPVATFEEMNPTLMVGNDNQIHRRDVGGADGAS